MITLNNNQKEAYEKIFNFLKLKKEKFFILTGSAGTGKTTLITEIIKQDSLKKKKIVLSATTNKAVSVMQKMYNVSNKNINFTTIHKLMQIKRVINADGTEVFMFNFNENPSSNTKSLFFYDIIIIDESSMISKELACEILSLSEKIKGQIIFIGDMYQLPPINEISSDVFKIKAISYNLEIVERSKNNIVKYSNAFRNHIKNSEKIKYKNILDDDVSIIKLFDDWLKEYLVIFKKDPLSIILAYTNSQCFRVNGLIRNKLFNNPSDKYIKGELIVFNNFYHNIAQKYYSSQHAIIYDINITQYVVDEFSFDFLFNLKLDIRKTEQIEKLLTKKEKNEDDLICPICFEEEKEFGETLCGHAFCMDCIKIWLTNNKSCPYCRMVLTDKGLKIKDDENLSKIINEIKDKISTMNYKVYELKLEGYISENDTVRVIHEDDIYRFNADTKFISENLIKIKKNLSKKQNDRLVKTVLQRLWEFYYYLIIDKFADISYGYAITVHKSQGSTYNNVFVDMNNICKTIKDKNQLHKCIYTAITRASKKLKLFI